MKYTNTKQMPLELTLFAKNDPAITKSNEEFLALRANHISVDAGATVMIPVLIPSQERDGVHFLEMIIKA